MRQLVRRYPHVAAVANRRAAAAMVISSALVDVVTEPETLTASYTTLVAAILLGMATGNYTAGSLSELAGGPSTFAAAAVALGSVAMWTFARRHTLLPK